MTPAWQMRRYLPQLIDLVLTGTIDPGKVFDLELPLSQTAEGYRREDREDSHDQW